VNNISGTVSVIDTATNMVTNDANTVLVIDRQQHRLKNPILNGVPIGSL